MIVLVLIKTRNLSKLKRRCYKVGEKWKKVDKFNYKLDPALSGLKDPWQKVKNRSNLRIFYPVCTQLLFQGLFSEKGAPLSKWKRKSERIWLKKIYYCTYSVHNNKFEMYLLLDQKNILIINSTQMTLSPATFPGNCQSPKTISLTQNLSCLCSVFFLLNINKVCLYYWDFVEQTVLWATTIVDVAVHFPLLCITRNGIARSTIYALSNSQTCQQGFNTRCHPAV